MGAADGSGEHKRKQRDTNSFHEISVPSQQGGFLGRYPSKYTGHESRC